MLTQLDADDSPRRDQVLVALGCGLALGVLLGCWCRAFAHSDSVNGVLANLASPWVAAAFASGAVVVRRHGGGATRRRSVATASAGAFAGTVCLVVATVVYYGPARTGGFDFGGAVVRTVFWTAAGVAAGTFFGAAGALWRASSGASIRAACAVALGAIVVGEAVFLAATGATRYDAFALPVLLVVSAVGLAVPLLLVPARRAPKAVAWIAVFAVPVAIGGLIVLTVAITTTRALRTVL